MSESGKWRHSWDIQRLVIAEYLGRTLLLWAGLVIAILGIVAGAARLGAVDGGVWAQASGIAPWYLAFVGGSLFYETVPLLVAHGRTRRDASVEAGITLLALSAFVAGLIGLGFPIERGLYALAGWSLGQPEGRLFSSHDALHLIIAEYWLRLAVWAAAGTFVGAAHYRYGAAGWLALAPAAALIGVGSAFVGPSAGPFATGLQRLMPLAAPPLSLAVAVSVASCCASLALLWPIVRDLPIRNR